MQSENKNLSLFEVLEPIVKKQKLRFKNQFE